jgi:hypothetical protein
MYEYLQLITGTVGNRLGEGMNLFKFKCTEMTEIYEVHRKKEYAKKKIDTDIKATLSSGS